MRADLDDHAVDAAGQPGDLAIRRALPTGFMKSSRLRRTTGRKPAITTCWRTSSRARSSRPRAFPASSGSADVPRRSPCAASTECAHPLRGRGYEFRVPLLEGDHVTDDVGTGFVHTAPGHGREDFDIWMANKAALEARGIDTTIPFTVDENGAFTNEAPGFTGRRVLTDKGERGDANNAVIAGARRCRHADRARPPQARLSAFLAFEEAAHLPQHAAMVRRHGQADRGRRRQGRGRTTRCAPARSPPSRRRAGFRPRARTASPAW